MTPKVRLREPTNKTNATSTVLPAREAVGQEAIVANLSYREFMVVVLN